MERPYDPATVDAQLRLAADRLDTRPERPVEDAAKDVLAKLDRLQTELDRLLGGLRSTAETLNAALPPTAPPATGERSGDADGARLVARTMAREGASREETARFLAEHYALDDLEALLDDVYR